MARPEDLDQTRIEAAASFAAHELMTKGVARVRLAPGDMTQYPILIAAPGLEWYETELLVGDDYWVALCFSGGAGYPWAGQYVDPGYAAQKWVARGEPDGTAEWTGTVMSKFLNELSQQMAHLRRIVEALHKP